MKELKAERRGSRNNERLDMRGEMLRDIINKEVGDRGEMMRREKREAFIIAKIFRRIFDIERSRANNKRLNRRREARLNKIDIKDFAPRGGYNNITTNKMSMKKKEESRFKFSEAIGIKRVI